MCSWIFLAQGEFFRKCKKLLGEVKISFLAITFSYFRIWSPNFRCKVFFEMFFIRYNRELLLSSSFWENATVTTCPCNNYTRSPLLCSKATNISPLYVPNTSVTFATAAVRSYISTVSRNSTAAAVFLRLHTLAVTFATAAVRRIFNLCSLMRHVIMLFALLFWVVLITPILSW